MHAQVIVKHVWHQLIIVLVVSHLCCYSQLLVIHYVLISVMKDIIQMELIVTSVRRHVCYAVRIYSVRDVKQVYFYWMELVWRLVRLISLILKMWQLGPVMLVPIIVQLVKLRRTCVCLVLLAIIFIKNLVIVLVRKECMEMERFARNANRFAVLVLVNLFVQDVI